MRAPADHCSRSRLPADACYAPHCCGCAFVHPAPSRTTLSLVPLGERRLALDTPTAGRICVSGSDWTAGRAVVQELVEHGVRALLQPIATTREERGSRCAPRGSDRLRAGARGAQGRRGCDSPANIAAPGICTPAVTFNANLTMNSMSKPRRGSDSAEWLCGRRARPRSAFSSASEPQQWPSLEAEGLPPRYARSTRITIR